MGGKCNVHELALLDQAGQALDEARGLDEIKVIRDKAEAVRKYAQSASLGLDVQNRAAEVKLRAERQAGMLLGQLMLRGGDRRSKSHRDRLKLDDLGLTPNQSKRWQLQARVPEEVFRDHVKLTCQEGKELTSAGLMRLAKRLHDEPIDQPIVRKRHSKFAQRLGSNGKKATNRLGKWTDAQTTSALGDIVGELANHHKVLEGILQPLYSGESASLHAAEMRMLRYLMTETGSLLAMLQKLDNVAGCACHTDRAVS